jgi:hypothetical protein
MQHFIDDYGYNRVLPWDCCTLCPDELNNWHKGRCLNDSAVTSSYSEIDRYADKTALMYMTSNDGCCYFCGEKSSDYLLSCSDKSLAIKCCPQQQLYCERSPATTITVQKPRIKSALNCYACMAVLNLLDEIRYKAIDLIVDELGSFCNYLFAFRKECVGMLQTETLKELVNSLF